MKIYVITKGFYSDYHICAVTTNPEQADKLAKFFSDKYEKADVEEYDTDAVPDLTENKKVFELRFNKGGFLDHIEEICAEYWDRKPRTYTNWPGYVWVTVLAKNQEDAIKIAAEKRAQFLAEQMGL